MYQRELKTKYLSHREFGQKELHYTKTVFDLSEELEEKLCKDLSQFSQDDFAELSEYLPGSRSSTYSTIAETIRKYTLWCDEQGLGTSKAAHKPKINNASAARKKWVYNPRHLDLELRKLFGSPDGGSYDVLYHAFFWLAYSGLTRKEAFQLKASDVNLVNGIVSMKGRTFPIYRESIPSLVTAAEATSFDVLRGSSPRPCPEPREYGDGTLLRGFKGPVDETVFSMQVVRRLSAVSDKSDFRPNYKNCRLSGIFYRARELELAGQDYAKIFEDVAHHDFEDKFGMDVEDEKMERRNVLRYIREYQKDYASWKQVVNEI